MKIRIRKVEYDRIHELRALYLSEADCQIVRDSILPRALADSYLISAGREVVGYGGVWNVHFKNRVMEFFTLPGWREKGSDLFREFVACSGATQIEAQSNLPIMTEIFAEFATDVKTENLLFGDGRATSLSCTDTSLRRRSAGDEGPDGEWVLVRNGAVVAAGGLLQHYNDPYRDIYMEVLPRWRRQGLGAFLVQELRRVCRDNGNTPAARCDPTNEASRRTLERGGMIQCGVLSAGNLMLETA